MIETRITDEMVTGFLMTFLETEDFSHHQKTALSALVIRETDWKEDYKKNLISALNTVYEFFDL